MYKYVANKSRPTYPKQGGKTNKNLTQNHEKKRKLIS